MNHKFQKVYKVLFCLYLAVLFWVLFNRSRYVDGVPYWEQVSRYVNLVPFKTIRLYTRLLIDPVRPLLTRLAIYNLAGNILLFLPMGALVPTLFPRFRSLFRTLLVVAAAVTAAELAQVLFLAGSCDVDDLILNLAGTAIAYPMHRILISE